MRHEIWVFASIGLVVFFILLQVKMPSPTGAAITKSYGEETYAVRLHDRAIDFFGVADLRFPTGSCMSIVEELYSNIAYAPNMATAGYSTRGIERLSTLSFVIDFDEIFGTIDFVKSPLFLGEQDSDSLISISTEAIVRLPKAVRTTYYVMDLYGISDTYFWVTRGRFSTPTMDCVFVTQNGDALCDCQVHTIKGISVAGITQPSTVETRYKELLGRVIGVPDK